MAIQADIVPRCSNNMVKRRESNGSMLVVNTTMRASTRLDPLSRMTLRRMTQINTDHDSLGDAEDCPTVKRTLKKMQSQPATLCSSINDTFMTSDMADPLANEQDAGPDQDVESSTPPLPSSSFSMNQFTSFDGYNSLKSTSDMDEALSKWLAQVQKAEIEYHKKTLGQQQPQQPHQPHDDSASEDENDTEINKPIEIDVTKYSFHRKSRAYTVDSRKSTRVKRGLSTPPVFRRNTSRETAPLCHGHALHLHFRTSDGQMMQVAKRSKKHMHLPKFASHLFSRRIRCFGVPEESAAESTRQSTDSNPELDETLRVVAHSPDGMIRGGDVISFARRDGFVLRIQKLSKKLCFNRKLDAKAKFIIAGVPDGTIVTESTKFYLQSVYDRSKIVGFARAKKPGHVGCLVLYNAGIKDDKCEPIQFFEKLSRFDNHNTSNTLQPLEEALEGFLPASARTDRRFFSRLVSSINL